MDNRPNSKAKEVVGAAVSLHMLRQSSFTATQVARYAGVSYNTARKWLERMLSVGDICKEERVVDAGVVQSVSIYGFMDDHHAVTTAALWNVSYSIQHRLPF